MEEPDQLLQCDMSIDRQIHPELYGEVSKIKDPRRRATFIRVCAEKYLVMKAASEGPQGFAGNGVTYHATGGKSHSTNVLLTTPPVVSNTAGGVREHHPAVEREITPPAAAKRHPGQAEANDQSMLLTTGSVVSNKKSGSATLASVLGGMTPGLR